MEDIDDVDIDLIDIKSIYEITIEGHSEVIVTLLHDRDYEEGDKSMPYSIPFTFSGTWGFNNKRELTLEDLGKTDFDISFIYD